MGTNVVLDNMLKFKKRHSIYKVIYKSASSYEEDLTEISLHLQTEQKSNCVNVLSVNFTIKTKKTFNKI